MGDSAKWSRIVTPKLVCTYFLLTEVKETEKGTLKLQQFKEKKVHRKVRKELEKEIKLQLFDEFKKPQRKVSDCPALKCLRETAFIPTSPKARKSRSPTTLKARVIPAQKSVSPIRPKSELSAVKFKLPARKRIRSAKQQSLSPTSFKCVLPTSLKSRTPTKLNCRSPIAVSKSPTRWKSKPPTELNSKSPKALKSAPLSALKTRSPTALKSPLALISGPPMAIKSALPTNLKSRAPTVVKTGSPNVLKAGLLSAEPLKSILNSVPAILPSATPQIKPRILTPILSVTLLSSGSDLCPISNIATAGSNKTLIFPQLSLSATICSKKLSFETINSTKQIIVLSSLNKQENGIFDRKVARATQLDKPKPLNNAVNETKKQSLDTTILPQKQIKRTLPKQVEKSRGISQQFLIANAQKIQTANETPKIKLSPRRQTTPKQNHQASPNQNHQPISQQQRQPLVQRNQQATANNQQLSAPSKFSHAQQSTSKSLKSSMKSQNSPSNDMKLIQVAPKDQQPITDSHQTQTQHNETDPKKRETKSPKFVNKIVQLLANAKKHKNVELIILKSEIELLDDNDEFIPPNPRSIQKKGILRVEELEDKEQHNDQQGETFETGEWFEMPINDQTTTLAKPKLENPALRIISNPNMKNPSNSTSPRSAPGSGTLPLKESAVSHLDLNRDTSFSHIMAKNLQNFKEKHGEALTTDYIKKKKIVEYINEKFDGADKFEPTMKQELLNVIEKIKDVTIDNTELSKDDIDPFIRRSINKALELQRVKDTDFQTVRLKETGKQNKRTPSLSRKLTKDKVKEDVEMALRIKSSDQIMNITHKEEKEKDIDRDEDSET